MGWKKFKHLIMQVLSSFVMRKWAAAVLFGVLVFGTVSQQALSQEVTPAFKITGPKKMEVYPGAVNQRAVEYDLYSADHLYISFLGPKGVLLEKTQYLFKGKKFNLADLQDYLLQKELLRDGIHKTFSKDQVLELEMIYKDDTLREQTNFYSNGEKFMTFAGDEKALNGKFIMWYSNGQISFQGRYKNNRKDGEFESFDESGTLERKGVYESGKLISGESVVQDFLYDAPEVPAQPADGTDAFNQYLAAKTAGTDVVKAMTEGVIKELSLQLVVDKKGKITRMEISSHVLDAEREIIDAAFKEFTGFKPALMEGAPVRSILKLNLLLSKKGLQVGNISETDSSAGPPYTIVEEMPEFPGLEIGLRQFIAQTIKYPAEALKKNIQGKVIVAFVILEDGSVTDISIFRSVHPLLDAEAMRIVKKMPKWKPGRQDGKAVRVQYTMPLNFVMQ